jgi:hypothetical protein
MSIVDAFIGAQGGIIAIWCTIPLEKLQQLSTTMKDENGKPKPYLTIAQEVLKDKGITAFWNGIDVLTVSVFFEKGTSTMAPHAVRFSNIVTLTSIIILAVLGMYFGFYSAITKAVQPASLIPNLFCGYVAELCRVPFVYPIEMVASRMMTRGLTTSESISQLYAEGGYAQFWKGAELFIGELSLLSLQWRYFCLMLVAFSTRFSLRHHASGV